MIKRFGYGLLAVGLLCLLGSCQRMSTAYDEDGEAPSAAAEDDGFDPNKPHWMP